MNLISEVYGVFGTSYKWRQVAPTVVARAARKWPQLSQFRTDLRDFLPVKKVHFGEILPLFVYVFLRAF